MKLFNRKKDEDRGMPRRRVRPVWRNRWSMAAGAMVLVASSVTGGWWLWSSGWIERAGEQAKWNLIAASGSLGFSVEDVLVVGRSQTERDTLLEAVKLARGAPILAYDLEAARRRIEVLPWIRTASVERMLPNTILLNIEERQPLALWQKKGRFHLIDNEGEVILKKGLERFSDLIVVVGEDAPEFTAGLLAVLHTQPSLMDKVESAVRVGGRRWNIRLRGGIDVRLPAENETAAWNRLAEYENSHGVLARDVRILDLRLPDRLIVRKASEQESTQNLMGQET